MPYPEAACLAPRSEFLKAGEPSHRAELEPQPLLMRLCAYSETHPGSQADRRVALATSLAAPSNCCFFLRHRHLYQGAVGANCTTTAGQITDELWTY